jgi:hypothetical protein
VRQLGIGQVDPRQPCQAGDVVGRERHRTSSSVDWSS